MSSIFKTKLKFDLISHIRKIIWFIIPGNHRGDVCESDLDQDGTIDTLDNCPNNKFINESDFGTYTSLDLNPQLTLEAAPSWMILHSGKEIRLVAVTAKPVAYVGKYFEKYI